MDAALDALPDNVETLKQALLSARTQAQEALVQTALVTAEKDAVAAELAVAKAKASDDLALIAHQKLRIAKLERQIYGPRSERLGPTYRADGVAARRSRGGRYRPRTSLPPNER